MRFRVEHMIDAPLARVEAAVLDPAGVQDLPRYVPSLVDAAVLSQRAGDDGVLERVVRYRPAFEPPPYALGFKREMAEWTERWRWDPRAHAGQYTIEPNIPAAWRARFRGVALYTLQAHGDAQTARVVAGEVAIDAPMFARAAERLTVARMTAHFAGEALMLAARAQRGVAL
jgi:hypothetical protein